MRRPLLTSLTPALLLFLPACTQTLDFDAVSKGQGSPTMTSNYNPKTFSCAALSPPATFCDSFDTKAAGDVWSAVLVRPAAGGGTVAGDSALNETPPNSLLATVPAFGSPPPAYVASIVQQSFLSFEGKPMTVHIAFDMMVEQIDNHLGERIMAFQFLFGLGDATFNQLVINVASTGPNITTVFTENLGGLTQNTAPSVAQHVPDLNTWAHVVFDLNVYNPSGQADRAGQGNSAKVTIDNTVLFDGGLHFPLYKDDPRIELGIPYVDTTVPTQPWRMRYDNFQATLTPL